MKPELFDDTKGNWFDWNDNRGRHSSAWFQCVQVLAGRIKCVVLPVEHRFFPDEKTGPQLTRLTKQLNRF